MPVQIDRRSLSSIARANVSQKIIRSAQTIVFLSVQLFLKADCDCV